MTEHNLEQRVNFLWERVCAQEVLIKFLLAQLAARDAGTEDAIKDWLESLATDEPMEHIDDIKLRPFAQATFDHVARFLVDASHSLEPPLAVPAGAAMRAQRIQQD